MRWCVKLTALDYVRKGNSTKCSVCYYFHFTLGYALCPSLRPQRWDSSSAGSEGREAPLEALDLHHFVDGSKECPGILVPPISTPHLPILLTLTLRQLCTAVILTTGLMSHRGFAAADSLFPHEAEQVSGSARRGTVQHCYPIISSPGVG